MEYIRDEKKLDMLTYARLVAYSEVCWTKPEDRNYQDFECRMENLRPYLSKLGCKICPQKIYRGKTYPWHAFTSALRWNFWRSKPDYEYHKMLDEEK